MKPTLSDTWAPFHFATDGSVTRAFGPLELTVDRSKSEWRVRQARPGELAAKLVQPTANDDVVRFATARTDDDLMVAPRLGDRPIIARPDVPVSVLPGEQVRFFVSTPMWVRIEIGEGRALVAEVPTTRLSDTWYGPNTRVGELCYASRTGARTELPDVGSDVRATTAVLVRNRSETHFRVERLKIPTQYLALSLDARGHLWTEEIAVEHTGGHSEPTAELTRRLPELAGETVLLEQPREVAPRGLLRIVDAIFT